METAAIVLSSLSLVASVATPILTALALFIGKIKRSTCCGNSSIELDPTNQPTNPPIILDRPKPTGQ